MTTANTSLCSESFNDVENSLWSMLDLDSLDKDMTSGEFTPTSQLMMGTGRTQNACEMCSNSNTTSGCGGC